MPLLWLSVTVTAAVAYHVIMKLTPSGANPYLSLVVTYVAGTLAFAAIYAVSSGGVPLRVALAQLNWTALALGVAVVTIDLGYLMIYRSGFDVSLGLLVTQSAAAMLLVVVGVAYFAEKLSLVNIGGIVLCVIGLWLVNRR
jgi:multidrug transporter EmrE-like cation transporter